MKARYETQQRVTLQSEGNEVDAAEPVMLIHLQQKLDYARKGLALAFTRVEIEYLQRVITQRGQMIGSLGEREE